LAAPSAAHAAGWRPVQLKLTIGAPRFLESPETLFYDLALRTSPQSAPATGVRVRITGWQCPVRAAPYFRCTPTFNETLTLPDLEPGAAYTGPLPVDLPDVRSAVWLRVTAEVWHVDQPIAGAVPGACALGQNPSDLCSTDVYRLLP
jgi:hypothetical protein